MICLRTGRRACCKLHARKMPMKSVRIPRSDWADGKNCRAGCADFRKKGPRNREAPPEGRGGARGFRPGPLTLEGGGHHEPAVECSICERQADHKRSMGSAAMQKRWAGKPGLARKKRGSNRSWSLMIGPKPNLKCGPTQGRRICVRPGGPWPREEDTAKTRCRVTRVRGRRIRSGVASTRTNIGFDRLVSNA